jgi:prepilin-type N-terminal cleavage/methylation domain-containing protein
MRMYKLEHFSREEKFRYSQGFTLIEVLIAIVLLAFISLYTYKMIDTNIDTKDRVLKEDQLLIQTLTAISRIDIDFTQIYSPLYSASKAMPSNGTSTPYQESSSTNEMFDGKTKIGMIIPQFQSEDKSSLVFLTASNRRKITDTKESRYTWIKYSVRRTEKSKEDSDYRNLNTIGENELIRQTISSNIYANQLNWNEAKSQILLTQVKSVEFSFWDERAKKYTTSIQELNENKNVMRAIKLNLIWVDEENHEQKIEKIFRILNPYFNTKSDDLKSTGAYGDSSAPPGIPNPQDVEGAGGEDDKNF